MARFFKTKKTVSFEIQQHIFLNIFKGTYAKLFQKTWYMLKQQQIIYYEEIAPINFKLFCLLSSIGCFSLRSLDVAKQNILLVLQMAHLDTLEVRKTALEVIFDLLMWYGLQGFLDTECDNIESVLDSTLTDTYTQGLFLKH